MPNRKKILYVEDDPVMQGLVAAIVEKAGPYELSISSTGMEALDDLRQFDPDLILLDVMMPGLAGTHTMHIIRTVPECHDVPVVFVTSKTSPQDMAVYEKLGAAAVIAKPFDPAVLISTIQTLCPQAQPAGTAAVAGRPAATGWRTV